jgi:hypothetical protein
MKPLAYVRTNPFLVTIIISFSVCSTLYPADLVSGKWKCEGKGLEEDDIYSVLEFQQSGETVAGSITYGERDRLQYP